MSDCKGSTLPTATNTAYEMMKQKEGKRESRRGERKRERISGRRRRRSGKRKRRREKGTGE